MNFIRATYDIEQKTWDIDTTEIGYEWNQVIITFYSKDDEYRDISNLNFGFSLQQNKQELLGQNYPIFPIEYEKVKTNVMDVRTVELIANSEYSLYVFASDKNTGNIIHEKTSTFKTGFPAKRFDSWHWNDSTKNWEAPIPHPDPVNGLDDPGHKLYQWSESRQQWIEGLPEEVKD